MCINSVLDNVTLTNTSAADGNFLEAINLVLNAYDMYYANRDLTRTGQEIVVISAGTGLFNNQYAGLGRITTKRLMDHGLSVDLICLSQPPLHSVPIFRYNKRDPIVQKDYIYYRSPDWINISFYLGSLAGQKEFRFIPTCRMPNIQDRTNKLFETKFLKLPGISGSSTELQKKDFEMHDENIFSEDIPTQLSSPTAVNRPLGRSFRALSHDNLAGVAEGFTMKNSTSFQSLESKELLSPTTSPLSHYLSKETFGENVDNTNSKKVESLRNNGQLTVVTSPPPPQPTAKELFHMRLFNPFDIDNSDDIKSPTSLQHRDQQNTFHRRRWAHLHPSSSGLRPTQKAEYIKHFLLTINWQSLSEPACLPLTTDYWPGDASLKNAEEFEINNYAVVDHQDRYRSTSMLMRELILQRLHAGFQVYVADDKEQKETSSVSTAASSVVSSSSDKLEQKELNSVVAKEQQLSVVQTQNTTDILTRKRSNTTEITSIKLASANQFHHIYYGTDRNIVVNRYITKDQSNIIHHNPQQQKTGSIDSKNKTGSTVTDNRFVYNYKYLVWNSTLNSLDNRNIRFCSKVSYNWNKLDQLISGFHDEMNKDLHNRSHQYHIIPITSSNRKYLASSSVHSIGSQPNVPAMSTSPYSPSNEPISPSASSFDSSFSNSLTLSGSDLGRRDVEYANRIKAFQKFSDVFLSNRRFKPPKGISKNELNIEIISQEKLEQPDYCNRPQPDMKLIRMEKIPSEENMDREEWFHLYYKPEYHPAETFCIKVQWLVCSASLIGEYIQTLARIAARFDFALVQTPVDTNAYTKHINRLRSSQIDHGFSFSDKMFDDELHPFRTFVDICLPSIEDCKIIKQKLCLAPFNFLPEHVPAQQCTKFLHESGCIMLEFGKNSVVWIDNPFHKTRQTKFNPQDLFYKVQNLCSTTHVDTTMNIQQQSNKSSVNNNEGNFEFLE
jgi:hypothetical protein